MTEKFLIWLNLSLFHFCFAYNFQKNYDAELFAIIDSTDRPKKFFQEQNLVSFNKFWFYHDHIKKNVQSDIEYLKLFEKKYNIQLWKLIINDRIFYNYNNFYKFTSDEILSIITQECRFYEKILDEIRPDYILMHQPLLRHDLLFYELCKAMKIKTIITNPANLGYKCFLSQKQNKLDPLKFDNSVSNIKTFEDLRDYLTSNSFKKQTSDFLQQTYSSKSGKLKAAKEFLFFSNNSNQNTHYTYFGRRKIPVLLNSINLAIKRKTRSSFLEKNSIKKIYDEPFIYFPLGSDPEASTLIASPLQNNQIEIIKQISKSLPIQYKLYVKEHPFQEQRDWRKISFYKQIKEIPNVRFLHPSVETSELYQKCSLVITISGTAGLEAVFFGKPSILFGESNFSQIPSIFHSEKINELPKLISTALESHVQLSDVTSFITLLEESSFDFDYYNFITKKEQYFFFNGFLIDTPISIPKMQDFLDSTRNDFQILVNEHIKKIQSINKIEKNY
tara:strand:- start:286 stop:1794 length:1509 start_codon:yes stop_codon:yes gene_type:complete